MSLMKAHQKKHAEGGKPPTKIGTSGPGGAGSTTRAQLMLLLTAALSVSLSALKDISSVVAKVAHKRDALLGQYAKYVRRLMDKGWEHDLLPYYMVWLLDVGIMELALEIGDYCLAKGIKMPAPDFVRSVPTIVADGVFDWAAAEFKADRSPEPYFSTVFERVTEAGKDDPWLMPDPVTAKYLKLMGQIEEKANNLEAAKGHYEKALEYGATVITVLKKITKDLATAAEADKAEAPGDGGEPKDDKPDAPKGEGTDDPKGSDK